MTQCSTEATRIKTLAKRSVVADFNGGAITSDAGALLLYKTQKSIACKITSGIQWRLFNGFDLF